MPTSVKRPSLSLVVLLFALGACGAVDPETTTPAQTSALEATCGCDCPATVAVRRFFNASRVSHYYTASATDPFPAQNGYVYEYVGFRLRPSASNGAQPLALYQNERTGRQRISFREELGPGWADKGVIGHAFRTAASDRMPIQVYRHPAGDWFYTVEARENDIALAGGWVYVGILGYVDACGGPVP